MQAKIKTQQGFLLIIAIILIVIIGFIGVVLAYMYIGGPKSNTNILRSNDAFYVATSGLEIAKRDVLTRWKSCNAISGNVKYTNAAFPPGAANPTGYFTVTSSLNNVKSKLSADINASATNIPLLDATGFAAAGFVLIEKEIITYVGVQGNTLQNARRGMAGTTAVVHNANKKVAQNMCVLTSVGQVPTATNPEGERKLQAQIMLGRRGYLAPGQEFPDNIFPVVIGAGIFDEGEIPEESIKIENDGTSISNPNADGKGCAVATPTITTKVDNPQFQCITANTYATTTWSHNISPPAPAIDTENFYDYFFDESIAELKARGFHATSKAEVDNIITPGQPGYGNDVVWITEGELKIEDDTTLLTTATSVKILIIEGNLDASKKNIVIGSSNGPVKLIVTNKFIGKENTVINGFIYAGKDVDIDSENFRLNGAIAAVENMTIKSTSALNFTIDVAGNLGSAPIIVQDLPEVFN